MKYIIFLFSACFFITCNTSKSPISPKLDNEFEINYGQSVNLQNHNLIIKFKAVDEDSRCPEGAVCVWEGNARIVIEISQTALVLNTTLEPKEIEHIGYKIRLTAVHPYPKTNEQIKIEDYSIKLFVTK